MIKKSPMRCVQPVLRPGGASSNSLRLRFAVQKSETTISAFEVAYSLEGECSFCEPVQIASSLWQSAETNFEYMLLELQPEKGYDIKVRAIGNE